MADKLTGRFIAWWDCSCGRTNLGKKAPTYKEVNHECSGCGRPMDENTVMYPPPEGKRIYLMPSQLATNEGSFVCAWCGGAVEVDEQNLEESYTCSHCGGVVSYEKPIDKKFGFDARGNSSEVRPELQSVSKNYDNPLDYNTPSVPVPSPVVEEVRHTAYTPKQVEKQGFNFKQMLSEYGVKIISVIGVILFCSLVVWGIVTLINQPPEVGIPTGIRWHADVTVSTPYEHKTEGWEKDMPFKNYNTSCSMKETGNYEQKDEKYITGYKQKDEPTGRYEQKVVGSEPVKGACSDVPKYKDCDVCDQTTGECERVTNGCSDGTKKVCEPDTTKDVWGDDTSRPIMKKVDDKTQPIWGTHQVDDKTKPISASYCYYTFVDWKISNTFGADGTSTEIWYNTKKYELATFTFNNEQFTEKFNKLPAQRWATIQYKEKYTELPVSESDFLLANTYMGKQVKVSLLFGNLTGFSELTADDLKKLK